MHQPHPPALTPDLHSSRPLSSDERFLQYSEGEAIIAAAEDNESALIPDEFRLMLNIGARIIRNANNGVRDSAVQA